MTDIAIIGYSGHAYVVIEALETKGFKAKYYIDLEEASQNPYDLEYLGCENSKGFDAWQKDIDFIIGIGDNKIRARVFNTVIKNQGRLINVIDSKADVSSTSKIGKGVFIAKNACVNAMAEVGDGAIINTSGIVEHECRVGSYSHVAPGASMLGASTIGDFAFLGAGAVLKEGVRVGSHSIIGAGAIVLEDVGENETWVGNPARKIK